jgi:hypothetical protein
MNVGELANYAEIIGGVAVLISLIYVAIQIRQNTAVVRTSNYDPSEYCCGQNIQLR